MKLAEVRPFQEQFIKQAAEHRTNNAFIGVVYKDKDINKYLRIGPGPCHGDLQAQVFQRKTSSYSLKDFTVLSSVQPLRVEKEHAKLFYEYLFNRSPWKKVFLTKTYEDAIENGIVVNTEQPSNLVISGLIASRLPTENYENYIIERMRVFVEILDLGFNENFALICAFLYKKDIGKNYAVIFSPIISGHCPFTYNKSSESYFRNFINNTPSNLTETSFAENLGYDYNTVTNLWANNYTDKFINWIKGIKPIKGKEKENLNIFEKIKTISVVYASKEDFKSVLLQLQERIFNEK